MCTCLGLFSLLAIGSASQAWPTETSSYPHHIARSVSVLSGEWNFTFDATYDVSSSTNLSFAFDAKQQVPGAWDAPWGTGIQYQRGTGAYRAKASVTPLHPSALHFAACSIFCRVYVDGVLLANHTSGGYTPFWVNVPASAKEEREVVVVTSNKFSLDLTPTHYQNYDFYQYGGIIREVSWHTFSPSLVVSKFYPHVNRVEVLPKAGQDGAPNGLVDLKVVLSSPDGTLFPSGARVSLRLTFDSHERTTSSQEYVVGEGGEVKILNSAVPSPKVWDPAAATRPLPLHTLAVEVMSGEAVADGLVVRFGLRVIATKGRDILVNGKPLKLKGVNRHDMFPNQGPVMTTEQYGTDLKRIQDTLHGNFIRGSHYPQDDRFLDLCDEMGVLVWAESLAWGNSAKTLNDKRFMTAQLDTVAAMVDTGFNHPSIILWGFFNECASDDASTEPAYATMANAFRSRDTGRLITWADNRMEASLSLKHADVISFNHYPGWYNGPYTTIEAQWEHEGAWVASHYPNSPFVISEAGAGGIVGNHSKAQPPSRWSLEYQGLVDGITTRTAVNSANISGISLWQFADIKVDAPNTSTGRPGGINNKGVFDRWRNAKPAAAAVAASYAGAALGPVVV